MTRTLASLLLLAMLVDLCPWQVPLAGYVKTPVLYVLSRVGLSQGQWSMFAPNPILNNGWVTAEMKTTAGEKLQWDSPIWSRASGTEKFFKFRTLNYFNRIVQPQNHAGVADLMEYLMRNAGEPIVDIQLYRNQLQLVEQPDGSLVPRDEAEWRVLPEPWLDRRQLK